MPRDYAAIEKAIGNQITETTDLKQRLQIVVDAAWDHLRNSGVSWIGFYLRLEDHDELGLGPMRDKPACSPIGMHGACGKAFRTATPLIVADVAELGDEYVACDPRDKSEVVLPFWNNELPDPVGVLDLDSFEVGAFDQTDVDGLQQVLQAAGLTRRENAAP